ncbi:uncharacterized protein LOC116161882 [Photinus pyralis]|nr:uncharacterized protein LOC116161882 [Photinus pyralis]
MFSSRSCKIELEKEAYHSGEIVNGKVRCNFAKECTVRDLTITFSGKARVRWEDGDDTYSKIETLFELTSRLLQCQTKFSPGDYVYPFTFNFPDNLPSSVEVACGGSSRGSIRYKARAEIDKEWSLGCSCEKVFNVLPRNECNLISASPVERTIEKIPTTFSTHGPIQLTVTLPDDRYVPSQAVPFVARLKNDSGTTVKELRFNITQGFTFHIYNRKKEITPVRTDQLVVINSVVEPGSKNLWNLQLTIPEDMFVGTSSNCNIMKVFWKLKGEVCLPFPHRNMHIEIPLRLAPRPESEKALIQ